MFAGSPWNFTPIRVRARTRCTSASKISKRLAELSALDNFKRGCNIPSDGEPPLGDYFGQFSDEAMSMLALRTIKFRKVEHHSRKVAIARK